MIVVHIQPSRSPPVRGAQQGHSPSRHNTWKEKAGDTVVWFDSRSQSRWSLEDYESFLCTPQEDEAKLNDGYFQASTDTGYH